MTTLPHLPPHLPNLTTHESITDTIHRICEAYDTNDFTLLTSACTPDVTINFNGHTLTGLDAIRTQNFERVAALDTTHHVSNIRISVADGGEEAKVTANALAMHYPAGKGLSGEGRRLLAGVRYVVDLVREREGEGDGGWWKIKVFELVTVWREGDVSVMG